MEEPQKMNSNMMNSNNNNKQPPTTTTTRKIRPKLKPISPDKNNINSSSSTFDDDDDDGGLGFGDIVTRSHGASSASNTPVEESNVEEEEKVKEIRESTLSVSFGRNVTSSSVPSVNVNEQEEDVDETISEVDSNDEEAVNNKQQLSSEPSSSKQQQQQRQKQHSAATTVTTVNGVDCMKQYSSISSTNRPLSSSSSADNNINNLSFFTEISISTNGEEEEEAAAAAAGDDTKVTTSGNVNNVISGEDSSKKDNVMIGNDGLSPIKMSSNDDEEEKNVQKKNEAGLGLSSVEVVQSSTMNSDSHISPLKSSPLETTTATNYFTSNDDDDDGLSVSSSSSSSNSSSSSESDEENDESTASDVPTTINNNENTRSTTQLEQLQSEIASRQQLLTKLLRGKEGSAYASLVRGQEDVVNSMLLDKAVVTAGTTTTVDKKSTNTIVAADNSTKAVRGRSDPFSTIKNMLVDEYYHTLPGAFSLIMHCLLYVTVYSIISKFVAWSCDVLIIYLTGWDATNNWFDCTKHEHFFYVCTLLLSLFMARITGVVFDWNENRMYQKRVAFQVRNKWYLKRWDIKLMNYFHGGVLYDKYEVDNDESSNKPGEEEHGGGGGTAKIERHRRWGPRAKYVFDLLSFFIAYKCVDYFVFIGTVHMSDITESILEGMPSRKLKDEQQDAHLDGVSYACSSVMSVLDNPYAADMLNWIASSNVQSDEARNWVTNAQKCGWAGGSPQVDEDESSKEDDTNEDSGRYGINTFITQKRIMNEYDDTYLRDIISREAYYELLGGDPNPRFSDPTREMLFYVTATSFCFGLLYFLGIPFLLI